MPATIWSGTVPASNLNDGPTPDYAMVRRALGLFCDPESWVQIQVLPRGDSSRFEPHDEDGVIEWIDARRGAAGCYFTINPVKEKTERAVKSGDIAERHWLLVDFDRGSSAKNLPIGDGDKAGNHSATDAEKIPTREAADRCLVDLSEKGWPLPIIVDSGNGWHLYWRIDLPATAYTQAVLRVLLQKLGERYDSDTVEVDKAVHDAKRIAKLPGTWARKGANTPERPHRLCQFVHVPDTIEVVTLEQLQAEAGTISGPGAKAQPPENRNGMWTGRAAGVGPDRVKAYVLRAAELEVGRVALSSKDRNIQLNNAALKIGSLLHTGHIVRTQIEQRLFDAACRCGLDKDSGGERGIHATIKSGMDAGAANPRMLPASLYEETRNRPGPSANGVGAGPKFQPGERIIYFASEVIPRSVEWLWPGRIPLGKLTTFAGVGGLGKTFVLCDLTARVTVGRAWPDAIGNEQAPPAGRVLFVSGEDDPDDTLVPRMIEMRADLEKVVFLKTEIQDRFTLADLETLDTAIQQAGEGIRFVAIDPPTAYLGGVDDHKNAELRGLLSPLKSWAAKHRLAVIFNTHINKGSGGKVEAMMRVMGSVAWVNAVRAAHMFAKNPDDPDERFFIPMKMNLAKERRGLRYRVAPSGTLAKIEWGGEVDVSADDALNHNSKPRRLVASEWLVGKFREKLEWRSDDLFQAGREEGISRDAIFEAKRSLDLPRARMSTLENGDRSWVWWVPAEWPPLQLGQNPAPTKNCPSCPSSNEVEY